MKDKNYVSCDYCNKVVEKKNVMKVLKKEIGLGFYILRLCNNCYMKLPKRKCIVCSILRKLGILSKRKEDLK